MLFGILLGMIVRPIILGMIYFLMFTPMAATMRVFERDELKLWFSFQINIDHKFNFFIKLAIIFFNGSLSVLMCISGFVGFS